MPGNEFSVNDAAGLMAVGRYYLPEMAVIYGDLNNEVWQSQRSDGVFKQANMPVWTVLRDYLQDYLGWTANNLNTAGGEVVATVENYEAADAQTKAAVESVWTGGNNIPGRYVPGGTSVANPKPPTTHI